MKRLRTLALAVSPRSARPDWLHHRVDRRRLRRHHEHQGRGRRLPGHHRARLRLDDDREGAEAGGHPRLERPGPRRSRWASYPSAPPRSPTAATRPAPRTGSTPRSRSTAARRRRGTTTPTASRSPRSPSSSPDLILATNCGHHQAGVRQAHQDRPGRRLPRGAVGHAVADLPRDRGQGAGPLRRGREGAGGDRGRDRRRQGGVPRDRRQDDDLRLPVHHRPLHRRHLRAAGPAGLRSCTTSGSVDAPSVDSADQAGRVLRHHLCRAGVDARVRRLPRPGPRARTTWRRSRRTR